MAESVNEGVFRPQNCLKNSRGNFFPFSFGAFQPTNNFELFANFVLHYLHLPLSADWINAH
jgi:hypothetical protein